jgi:hypothetical protein
MERELTGVVSQGLCFGVIRIIKPATTTPGSVKEKNGVYPLAGFSHFSLAKRKLAKRYLCHSATAPSGTVNPPPPQGKIPENPAVAKEAP